MSTQKFLDKIRFHVIGGRGGRGNLKLGTIGGNGGDVILKATKNYYLNDTREFVAKNKARGLRGGNPTFSNLTGTKGSNAIINVPMNCVVYNSMNKKIGQFINENDVLTVAKGGVGGCNINHFKGEPGMWMHITVMLKMLADVGFIGFPNAGKSTLLTTLSKAKPMISCKPFTTVQPLIGHVNYKDSRSLTLVDLPALVDGASINQGLGHHFLQHAESSKLLLYVIDIDGFQLSEDKPHRSAFECIMLLNKELEIYNRCLLFKPALLVINKMDKPGSSDKFTKLFEQLKNREELYQSYPAEERPTVLSKFSHVLPISAKSKKKGDYITTLIRNRIDEIYIDEEKEKNNVAKEKMKYLLTLGENKLMNF